MWSQSREQQTKTSRSHCEFSTSHKYIPQGYRAKFPWNIVILHFNLQMVTRAGDSWPLMPLPPFMTSSQWDTEVSAEDTDSVVLNWTLHRCLSSARWPKDTTQCVSSTTKQRHISGRLFDSSVFNQPWASKNPSIHFLPFIPTGVMEGEGESQGTPQTDRQPRAGR